jgi:group I intron endonuclease
MIIYKATNLVNNKIYIGQTKNEIEKRIKGHIKESKNENTKRPFLISIKKHGIDNFLFEEIDRADTFDELDEKEIYWINFYNSTNNKIGYNILGGGQGKKMITNEAYSKIISDGLKNSEKWQKLKNSEEHKNKMKEIASKTHKGRKFTKEHKEKIWEKNKNRILEFNKSCSKKWIIVDSNNNIQRIESKDLFFQNLGLDSSSFTRLAQKLDKGLMIKRLHDYYCFYDNNQTDIEIINKVNELETHFVNENIEIHFYNKKTKEHKKLLKNNIYSFCIENKCDYSNILKVIKRKLKSYRGWVTI